MQFIKEIVLPRKIIQTREQTMKITMSPLIAAFGMKTWRLRSKRVVFGWKALCSSEQVSFVGCMSAFGIIDF